MKFTSLLVFLTTALVSNTFAHPRASPEPGPLPEALASPEAFPEAKAVPHPVPDPVVEADAHGGLESRAPLARVITRCTRPNTVALTFDDGPYIYQGGECIAYLLGITMDTDQT